MEKLAKEIDKILTQYLQENLGNRLSQFSMKGLRDVLITTIQNYKPTKNKVAEVKKGDVKK